MAKQYELTAPKDTVSVSLGVYGPYTVKDGTFKVPEEALDTFLQAGSQFRLADPKKAPEEPRTEVAAADVSMPEGSPGVVVEEG